MQTSTSLTFFTAILVALGGALAEELIVCCRHVRTEFIRPLCLIRLITIECAIKNYETIIDSFLEMSAKTGDTAVKANGLHHRFMKENALLGL